MVPRTHGCLPPPPYLSFFVKHLHHHGWGLVTDPPGVPIKQHPVEEQRLVPARVQGAGEHPGALADVHEGHVGDGVCGGSTHHQHPRVPAGGVRSAGEGGGPTCSGLGAVGHQLQRLEEVAAQLEVAGPCGRGRGWQGVL